MLRPGRLVLATKPLEPPAGRHHDLLTGLRLAATNHDLRRDAHRRPIPTGSAVPTQRHPIERRGASRFVATTGPETSGSSRPALNAWLSWSARRRFISRIFPIQSDRAMWSAGPGRKVSTVWSKRLSQDFGPLEFVP